MIPFMAPMMMGRSGVVAATAWDPAFNTTGLSYSNGNRTVTNTISGNNTTARGSTSGARMTGRLYFEVRAVDVLPNAGVVNATHQANNYPGQDPNGSMLYGGTVYENGATATASVAAKAGDVVGVAVDFVAKTIAYYVNGALSTTRSYFPSGALHPACNPYTQGGAYTINCGQTAFAYPPPSGFTAWG